MTHRAIDAAGNESLCTQTITVTDDEALVLTCSDAVTVDAPADQCSWTGTQTALATDNCSDELTATVTGTYVVGESPIVFTAADGEGNSAECTTLITVRDVTAPVVTCGTPFGAGPTVIRATASDACAATVTIEDVVCTRTVDGVAADVPLTECPVRIDGSAIFIEGTSAAGFTLTYEAHAVDPSGNVGTADCTTTASSPKAMAAAPVAASNSSPSPAWPSSSCGAGSPKAAAGAS